ncbi:hypothetical protein [Paraburkholderia kirstenboschensis]|uniref:hypothetical protein n=1 Tax=Paraburkholderia kirstenboschensis TaxID=1245436 RepID=UPI0013E2AECA|nr:hypothetical protein [Paraburkholderia kirstenboschensis]
MLFDFVVDELRRHELVDPHLFRPVRVALQNQPDDLLACAGVLDAKRAAIVHASDVPGELVRAACVLHRKLTALPVFWQGWRRLRSEPGGQFHAVFRPSRRSCNTRRARQFAGDAASAVSERDGKRRAVCPIAAIAPLTQKDYRSRSPSCFKKPAGCFVFQTELPTLYAQPESGRRCPNAELLKFA